MSDIIEMKINGEAFEFERIFKIGTVDILHYRITHKPKKQPSTKIIIIVKKDEVDGLWKIQDEKLIAAYGKYQSDFNTVINKHNFD